MEPRRRFRFLKQLSEGTFGRVYMAEMITDNNFSSVVAIKLLHGKWLGHEEIVQRSRDEARVLGLLHHRSIIRVEDLTSINGQCAVIMEYLKGVDLKSLINYCAANQLTIPRKVALELVAAAASAMEAAYYRPPLQGGEPLRLIHRDIKPSNIMVTVEGDVKVLDFGTAQARFEEREARTQALAFGSQAYMSPERLLGDPDAPSGDIFSLGVTLYELLSLDSFGKIHIRPERYEEALRERISGLDLSTLDDAQANELRDLLWASLVYDPQERPDARIVLERLEDLAEQIHDGSLRRFCKDVVEPCLQRGAGAAAPNPDDPLAGSTLFEDVSAFADELADAIGTTPPAAPPPLEPTPTATGSAPIPVATPAPTPALASVPEEPPAATDTVPDPVAAEASAPRQRPAAPPPPATIGAQRVTPTIQTPSPTPARTPAPEPAPEPKPSGGGLKWVLIGGAALLFLAVLGGGAVVVAGSLIRQSGDGTPPPEPIISTPSEPVTAGSAGIPGQRIEVGEAGPTTGSVVLRLSGGSASVRIDAASGAYEQDWDGSGELELINLPAGLYKTRIKGADGTVRTTLDVVAEKTCTYTFPVGQGVEEWTRDCP